jgi:hypothetical protein
MFVGIERKLLPGSRREEWMTYRTSSDLRGIASYIESLYLNAVNRSAESTRVQFCTHILVLAMRMDVRRLREAIYLACGQ